MKAYDNGDFYSVVVSELEVATFGRYWPGSNLPAREVTFQFDKRNGDLVDITTNSFVDFTDAFHGSAALALSQDAQAFGIEALKLEP